MSEENIQLLRRAWESFVARDPAGLDYLDPDLVFEVRADVQPDGGVFYGHDGYRELVSLWAGHWGDYHQEPHEFIDAGADRAIVVANTTVRSKDTDLAFEMDVIFVFRLRGRKIVHIVALRDRREAFRLVSEPPD